MDDEQRRRSTYESMLLIETAKELQPQSRSACAAESTSRAPQGAILSSIDPSLMNDCGVVIVVVGQNEVEDG